MPRDYVTIRPQSSYFDDTLPSEFFGTTVYEEHDLIDIGIVDAAGNKIMARQRMEPVGFQRLKER